MKKYIKEIICLFPFFIKKIISEVSTFLNKEKRNSILEINNKKSKSFPSLNTIEFKKNLVKCMNEFILNATETKEFIDYLYNEDLELIKEIKIDKDLPTIICVVKDEKEKLIKFFDHYEKLGKFNYIFVDNNSTDGTLELLLNKNANVYLCKEKFNTLRKVSWICRIHSMLPLNNWSVLLDADELLVYENCENMTFNEVIEIFEKNNIQLSGAVMLDMFSPKKCKKNNYFAQYRYFQNEFIEKKSYLFNSIYGGIRNREFNFNDERIFLIKKHPVMKKTNKSMIIHCHYIYPFYNNFKSSIFFGLLHYKLFDSEIDKYKKIAEEGSYGNGGGSVEYKKYLEKLVSNKYEDIFRLDSKSIKYESSKDLAHVNLIKKISNLNK